MKHQRKASILPFRAPISAGPTRARGSKEGVVVPLRVRRKEADHQAGGNSAWDELTHLVLEAWCWRDPESLQRLEACVVGRLRPEVEREWGWDGGTGHQTTPSSKPS